MTNMCFGQTWRARIAKTVTAYFDDNDINYVKRVDNPPNVPEVRPIMDFW